MVCNFSNRLITSETDVTLRLKHSESYSPRVIRPGAVFLSGQKKRPPVIWKAVHKPKALRSEAESMRVSLSLLIPRVTVTLKISSDFTICSPRPPRVPAGVHVEGVFLLHQPVQMVCNFSNRLLTSETDVTLRLKHSESYSPQATPGGCLFVWTAAHSALCGRRIRRRRPQDTAARTAFSSLRAKR